MGWAVRLAWGRGLSGACAPSVISISSMEHPRGLGQSGAHVVDLGRGYLELHADARHLDLDLRAPVVLSRWTGVALRWWRRAAGPPRRG